jgi:MYXO-CTERM domain-containing protein
VDGTDQTLSVMLGKNDGTFAPAVLVSLASKPTQFVLADVDGDGHPDLLVPDSAADTLDIYLNDGHGGFAAPLPTAAGDRPFSIAGADLDGDGDVDLVVGDHDDSMSVLLNDGHGGFSVTGYSTGGVSPAHLYLGTMMTASVFISATDGADDAGAYFQGNGDGTFQAAVLNDGGNCATTICATATPVTTGQGGGGTSKPGKKPVVTTPASGGGGDFGFFGLMLIGLAGLIRRFAR